MSRQAGAFGASLGIHAIACAALLLAGMAAPRRAIVLDFSLSNAAETGRPHAPAAKQPALKREQKTVTPTVPDKQAVPVPKEQTEEAVMPVSEEPTDANEETVGSDNSASSNTGSAEAARAGYLGVHFIHIRDKIFKRLSYPLLARRMGWAGRVTVAFTVCPDGSVEDVSIVESSGFAALDRSAVEAVKRSCPLPRPPMKTALVMPVVYRLE